MQRLGSDLLSTVYSKTENALYNPASGPVRLKVSNQAGLHVVVNRHIDIMHKPGVRTEDSVNHVLGMLRRAPAPALRAAYIQ